MSNKQVVIVEQVGSHGLAVIPSGGWYDAWGVVGTDNRTYNVVTRKGRPRLGAMLILVSGGGTFHEHRDGNTIATYRNVWFIDGEIDER